MIIIAVKFVQTGGNGSGSGSGTYDHNLLINRGLPDQHTIESITGLRSALDRKYEKPMSGIPKTDLAFNVATMHDLDVLRKSDIASVDNQLLAIADEIREARGNHARLKEYIDTKVSYGDWSGSGGGSSSGGHLPSQIGYPLYEEHRAIEGQITFSLSKTYRMGTRQLEVYLNGLRMVQDDDYIEKDDQTIDFLFPLNQDDLVVFQVRAVVNSGLHEEYYASEGQTRFTLANPYGIHQNILQVFRNGVLQRKGRDYTEIDNLTVDFKYPLNADDYVTFHQAGATDPAVGSALESMLTKVKMNLGYTTMQLHDVAMTTQTDYNDMYVDTFITDNQIDQEASYPYIYDNQAIEVGLIAEQFSTTEDFINGTLIDTDIQTYRDEIRLKNLSGGAEGHSFNSPIGYVTGNVLEARIIHTNRHRSYYAYVTDDSAERILSVIVDDKESMQTIELGRTDGYFFGIEAEQDSFGNVHIVYHEQGSSFGVARVHYAIIRNDNTIYQDVLSHAGYDAMSADLAIDSSDTVHVCFVSKRLNQQFNIDYIRVDQNQSKTGIQAITSYDSMDAANPRIVVGNDNRVRIAFESLEYDGVHKNIKLAFIRDGIKENEIFITVSTTHHNIQPDIDIDSTDRCRLVWRSTRLSSNYGIDYCSVGSNDVVTTVKSILSGSVTCKRPRISCDYEDNSHIVFHANYTLNDTENICYTYVYADNTTSSIQDIASQVGAHYTDPTIHAYGDRVLVSSLKDTDGILIEKSLRNYTSSGRYHFIVDGKTEESDWQSVTILSTIEANTSLDIEYRISEDKVVWSSWKTIDQLSTDTTKGRYLELRFTLQTTDPTVTPVVHQIQSNYTPSYIEVQSLKKTASTIVDKAVVLGKYEGDVRFYLSRDGGMNFMEVTLNDMNDITSIASGSELVIKAKIPLGDRLHAWAVLW